MGYWAGNRNDDEKKAKRHCVYVRDVEAPNGPGNFPIKLLCHNSWGSDNEPHMTIEIDSLRNPLDIVFYLVSVLEVERQYTQEEIKQIVNEEEKLFEEKKL